MKKLFRHPVAKYLVIALCAVILPLAYGFTVGGMPTVAGQIDIVAIARGCGYPEAICFDSVEALDEALRNAREAKGLKLIEVKCSIGARDDLGRPTVTAMENKINFMRTLGSME